MHNPLHPQALMAGAPCACNSAAAPAQWSIDHAVPHVANGRQTGEPGERRGPARS